MPIPSAAWVCFFVCTSDAALKGKQHIKILLRVCDQKMYSEVKQNVDNQQ
jgi:hypothetical protein